MALSVRFAVGVIGRGCLTLIVRCLCTSRSMRNTKVVVGLLCIVTGIILPGFLALGFASNFGFGRTSPDLRHHDYLVAGPFVLLAIGMIGSGWFLIKRRDSAISMVANLVVTLTVVLGVAPTIATIRYLRAHSQTQADAVRSIMREVDQFKQQMQTDTNAQSASTNLAQ